VKCIITLSGSLLAISAVIKSYPGDFPNRNFCISVFIPLGVKGLGGRVIGSGLPRKSYILFFIEGTVKLLGLKTLERSCLCVSAFSLLFLYDCRQIF